MTTTVYKDEEWIRRLAEWGQSHLIPANAQPQGMDMSDSYTGVYIRSIHVSASIGDQPLAYVSHTFTNVHDTSLSMFVSTGVSQQSGENSRNLVFFFFTLLRV